MTILDAACEALKRSGRPMSVKEIYEEIVGANLYRFGAKSPRSVLSGTLRNHVKKSPNPRVVEVSSGVYEAS